MNDFVQAPNASDAWPQITSRLRTVAQAQETLTSSDLRDLISDIFGVFNLGDNRRKFEHIPSMLESLPAEVVTQFLSHTFPTMCGDLETKIDIEFACSGKQVPWFSSGLSQKVRFTPTEAYYYLAMCFLCIPLCTSDGKFLIEGTCHLFFTDRSRINSKLCCFLNYFNVIVAAKTGILPHAVSEAILGEHRLIEIERVVEVRLKGAEWWCEQAATMSAVEIRGRFERIESTKNSLQADFANRHIGGGVLRRGCVQEEIRFMISPECLLTVLLNDPLNDSEAVIIRNTIQFSDYAGYSSSFRCLGLSKSLLGLFTDSSSSLSHDEIVVIDAIPFGLDSAKQFHLPLVLRELEKCRIGLSSSGNRPFATGNWGCGAFGGDTQLKAVIQWLGASVNGRQMIFFPFEDERTGQFATLVQTVVGQAVSVGYIFQLLLKGIAENQVMEETTIGFLIAELHKDGDPAT